MCKHNKLINDVDDDMTNIIEVNIKTFFLFISRPIKNLL
jgi:hypothetical protein